MNVMVGADTGRVSKERNSAGAIVRTRAVNRSGVATRSAGVMQLKVEGRKLKAAINTELLGIRGDELLPPLGG
jgi:hypothetical protein